MPFPRSFPSVCLPLMYYRHPKLIACFHIIAMLLFGTHLSQVSRLDTVLIVIVQPCDQNLVRKLL